MRYRYIGPAHLAQLAESSTPRLRVRSAADLRDWLAASGDDATFTFVVLDDGVWIADRHSEHVACARGQPVLSAGEIAFAVDRRGLPTEAVYVSNQSTGYCPQPESWPTVAAALEAAGIAHPGEFTVAMTFRRCPQCQATNIVKDGWFRCDVCGADLPAEWNF